MLNYTRSGHSGSDKFKHAPWVQTFEIRLISTAPQVDAVRGHLLLTAVGGCRFDQFNRVEEGVLLTGANSTHSPAAVVETQLKVQLPKDYKEFLRGEGFHDYERLVVFGYDGKMDLNDAHCVVRRTKEFREERPDKSGTYVVVSLCGNGDPVVLDTDTNEVHWLAGGQPIRLAKSFRDWYESQLSNFKLESRGRQYVRAQDVSPVMPRELPGMQPVIPTEILLQRQQIDTTRELMDTVETSGQLSSEAFVAAGEKTVEAIRETARETLEAIGETGNNAVTAINQHCEKSIQVISNATQKGIAAVEKSSSESSKWSRRHFIAVGLAFLAGLIPYFLKKPSGQNANQNSTESEPTEAETSVPSSSSEPESQEKTEHSIKPSKPIEPHPSPLSTREQDTKPTPKVDPPAQERPISIEGAV